MAKQAMDSTGFENFLGFSFYIEQRRGKKRKFFFPQFNTKSVFDTIPEVSTDCLLESDLLKEPENV